MKKYVTYKCNVCKRVKEFPVNNITSDIDKCTITLRCEGKMQPVGTTNVRGILSSSPVAGLADWFPRGTTFTNAVVSEPILLFSLATGGTETAPKITLAVLDTEDNPPSSITVNATIAKDTPNSFIEFTYNKKAPFASVNGMDSTSSGKVLKFTGASEIKVLVNGVEIDSSEYSTTTINNTIVFNSSISTDSTVKVLVYNVPTQITKALTFFRNTQNSVISSNTAWANVDKLEDRLFDPNIINSPVWHLYSCADLTVLGINTTITKLETVGINNDRISLLMANKPFSPFDRSYGIKVSFDTFNQTDNAFIKYQSVGGVVSIKVSEPSVSPVFPPFRLREIFVQSVETDTSSNGTGVSNTTIKSNKYILGPV